MIKKSLKLIVLILLTLFIITPSSVLAKSSTLAELRQELATLKKKKADNQAKKTMTQGEINKAKNNVINKENEIDKNKQKVIDATNESEKLEIEIAEGKEELEKIVKTYQLAKGDNVYLEYVFEATSYEDLVYRYAVMEQIMEYQKNEINKWKEKIAYNDQLKKDLAAREIVLNKQIDGLAKDIDKLGKSLDELDEMFQDINAEIKSVQDSINFYTSIGCGEHENLDACLSVNGDRVFRRPLTSGHITSQFGYRTHPVTGKKQSFHSGTDIGVKEGTKVYSIANGTVCKLTKKSSCGGNMVYVQHIVNGKKYTSTYMHLLTINVKIGQKLTSESVVGLSGGSSTGTRKGGYDQCTTGGHLHLSLATGWYEKDYFSYSTWRSHLINPKTTLKLPSSWSKRDA